MRHSATRALLERDEVNHASPSVFVHLTVSALSKPMAMTQDLKTRALYDSVQVIADLIAQGFINAIERRPSSAAPFVCAVMPSKFFPAFTLGRRRIGLCLSWRKRLEKQS